LAAREVYGLWRQTGNRADQTPDAGEAPHGAVRWSAPDGCRGRLDGPGGPFATCSRSWKPRTSTSCRPSSAASLANGCAIGPNWRNAAGGLNPKGACWERCAAGAVTTGPTSSLSRFASLAQRTHPRKVSPALKP